MRKFKRTREKKNIDQLVVKRRTRRIETHDFYPERKVVFILTSAVVLAGDPSSFKWPGGASYGSPLTERIAELDDNVELEVATADKHRFLSKRGQTTYLMITGRTVERMSVCISIPFRPEYVYQVKADGPLVGFLRDLKSLPSKYVHSDYKRRDNGDGFYVRKDDQKLLSLLTIETRLARPAYGFCREDTPFVYVTANFENTLKIVDQLIKDRFDDVHRCERFIKQEQRVFRKMGMCYGRVHTASKLVYAHKGSMCSTYADTELKYVDGSSTIAQEGPPIVDVLCCGYDIETYSDNLRVFTNAKIKAHEIVCISCVLWWTSDPTVKFRQATFSRRDLKHEGISVKCVDETDVMRRYSRYLREEDPDVMFAYNNCGFDDPFLYTRDQRYCRAGGFSSHGRLIGTGCFFLDQNDMSWKTNQKKKDKGKGKDTTPSRQRSLLEVMGLGEDKPDEDETAVRVKGYYMAFGRVYIDLMLLIMGSFKQTSYSLKVTCANLLPSGTNKVDLSIRALFAAWKCPDYTDDLRRTSVYCVRDAELMCDLSDAVSAVQLTWQAAAVSNVPPGFIYVKGQSNRGLSALFHQAGSKNMVLSKPVIALHRYFEKYPGAVVLDVVPGLHDNVACEDLASLYPSIMLAWSLCISSLLIFAVDGEPFTHSEADCKGLDVHRMTLVINDHRFDIGFVQMRKTALCPAYLTELLSKRKREKGLKAQFKKDGNQPMAKLFDAAQASTKVAANSVYGLLGLLSGAYSCALVSAAVTQIGRGIIGRAEELSTEKGLRVIGGDTDSVFVRMPSTDLKTMVTASETLADDLTNDIGRDPILWGTCVFLFFFFTFARSHARAKR
jgi:DNA polymerase elongation subunit (family B)